MKYIVDIKGEIEGDYEIIGKYEDIENAPTINPCKNCELYFMAMTKEEQKHDVQ